MGSHPFQVDRENCLATIAHLETHFCQTIGIFSQCMTLKSLFGHPEPVAIEIDLRDWTDTSSQDIAKLL